MTARRAASLSASLAALLGALAAACTERPDVDAVSDSHGNPPAPHRDAGAASPGPRPEPAPTPAAPAPTRDAASEPPIQTPILASGDECVVDQDCPLWRPHCCGCEEVPECYLGTCRSVEWCADAECCFLALGCDAECRVDTPHTDYDGTCGGVVCADVVDELDPRYSDAFEAAACCTGGDDALAEPGEHCGVDAVLLGGIEPGSCVQIVRPGALHPDCGEGRDPYTGAIGEGCCTSAGRCGVMTEGFGCVDLGTGRTCRAADAGP